MRYQAALRPDIPSYLVASASQGNPLSRPIDLAGERAHRSPQDVPREARLLRKTLAPVFVAAAIAAAMPAAAQQAGPVIQTPVDPASVEGVVGTTILHFVRGRSLEQAGGPALNPFGIDADSLLFMAGAFFITTEYQGEPVHEGELSILPQFATPLGAYEPSRDTPATIPFALVKRGTCHAGFVAGHPVPDTLYAVDMAGQICHAAIVEEMIYAAYAANLANRRPEPEQPPESGPASAPGFDPAFPSDIDLDLAVWAAYNAAYDLASNDPEDRFIRDGNFARLRNAMIENLVQEGLPGVSVGTAPAETIDAAFGCAEPGTTVLRVAFTGDGLGITIVAASAHRQSSYRYDPDLSADLDIRAARACNAEGLGRVHTVNVR
jgi:hypothetical protein